MTPEIVTLLILGVMVLGMMGSLVWVIDEHNAERESWEDERRYLVDRAIARHAGEVIAFDREGKPKPERVDAQTINIEGLS